MFIKNYFGKRFFPKRYFPPGNINAGAGRIEITIPKSLMDATFEISLLDSTLPMSIDQFTEVTP